MNSVLIIGKHTMTDDVIAQYRKMNRRIDFYETCSLCEVVDFNGYDELFLFPVSEDLKADEVNMQMLFRVASGYNQTIYDGRKIVCHWCVADGKMLEILKEVDFPSEINSKMEIYPFSVNEMWAQNLLCGLNKGNGWKYRPLDADGIRSDDDRVVHLVIVGFTEMGRCLALQAALAAHYPNYVRNHRLRTRITVVSQDMNSLYPIFVERYKNLFENSYYRVVDVGASHPEVLVSTPMYASERTDFVDVEWEFVNGDLNNSAIKYKLEKWAVSEQQILTVALCCDERKNISMAYSLPDEVYRHKIPVWVYTKNDVIMRMMNHSEKYSSICPFGMNNVGYDIRMPLVQMAKLLNYYYSCSYSDKGFPTEFPDDEVQREWEKLGGYVMRHANIYNVITIPSKMRSLGYGQYAWGTYIALTKDEIEILAAVEHNRWNVERMILGFRPCNNAQRLEIKANINEILAARKKGVQFSIEDLKKKYKNMKVHYDICAYEDLDVDATGKNARVYDVDLTACLPLIVNSFNESYGFHE